MNRTLPTNFPDELNLARYIDVVRRRWLVVLVCAVLGAGITYYFGSLQAKMYQAQADMVVMRTGTIVSFDPKIRTISDTDPNAQSIDALWRRPSLIAIGTSQELAKQVIARVGPQLPANLREPGALASRIQITSNLDLFSVRATAETPELAALIANEWEQAYEAQVNKVYSERPESVEILRAQSAQAKQEYDAKQQEFVDFIKVYHIESLKRQQAVIALQIDSKVQIDNKLIQLGLDVQALRTRLQTSGTTVSSADELTLTLIQATAFNNGLNVENPLRFDVTSSAPISTAAEQLAQLDSLAQAIEQRRTAISAEQTQALYTELNKVQTQLEQEQQKFKDLQAARDLAFDTLQSLNTKVSEAMVTASSENQVVRLAAPAVPSGGPIQTRGVINAVIGGALGLIVGLLLAMALEFLRARMQVAAVPSHKPAPQ